VVVNHGIDIVSESNGGMHVDLEERAIPFALSAFVFGLHDGFVEGNAGFDFFVIVIGFERKVGKHSFRDLVAAVVRVGQRFDLHVGPLFLWENGGIRGLIEDGFSEVDVFFHVGLRSNRN
jgi:hypothetical protein